jgi:hypothetical protein
MFEALNAVVVVVLEASLRHVDHETYCVNTVVAVTIASVCVTTTK